MNAKGLVLGALLAGGAVYTLKTGCFMSSEKAPDAKLADHFEKMMCGIARDNIKTPEKGVRKLGQYLDKNVGDMFGNFGEMLATIERIPDDAKHDKRAMQARDRLSRPGAKCGRYWQQFGEAIAEDEKAMELLERFNERLGRTFEIIFGDGAHFDVLHLPEKMLGVVDRK